MAYEMNGKATKLFREMAAAWPKVKDATNRILTLRGDGITNSRSGIVINTSQLAKQAGRGGRGSKIKLLYIDSIRTMKEAYKAYIVNLTTTTVNVGSGAFSLSAIGNITDATEVTAFNSQQGDSPTTHLITESPQKLRLVLGYKLSCQDNSGRDCYLIVAKDFEDC